MILLDANLLVYAYVGSMPQHDASRVWLDDKLNGAAPVGFPWPSLMVFVRLVSNPRVFERSATTAAAWQQVESWLDCACSWIPLPTERHREVLASLLRSTPRALVEFEGEVDFDNRGFELVWVHVGSGLAQPHTTCRQSWRDSVPRPMLPKLSMSKSVRSVKGWMVWSVATHTRGLEPCARIGTEG